MTLQQALLQEAEAIAPMFSFDLNGANSIVADCSKQNNDLEQIDLSDTAAYARYSKAYRTSAGARAAVGGYLERRVIYSPKKLFKMEEEARNIHLGIDVSTEAGTIVYCPFQARIHSFADNDESGDYGPTIVLEHRIESFVFHSLYGHLSLDSLNGLHIGKPFEAGDYLGRLGNFPSNGDWPPHLHFQLIIDMEGKVGDYPGVCAASKLDFYQQNCPDPNLILRIDKL